jgi:hypothetical protein
MGTARVGWVVMLALLVAACSSGPGEADMKEAMDRLFRQEVDTYNAKVKEENKRLGRAKFAEKSYPVIAQLKKIDCVRPDSKPGYICYFEMSLDGMQQKRPGRFYVEGGSWVYARP